MSPIAVLWVVLFAVMARCAYRLGRGTGGVRDVIGVGLALIIGLALVRGGG